jgi:enoyl-[acyl-carrier-protein] reductase (NADH)
MVEFVAPLNSKKHRLVPLIRRFAMTSAGGSKAIPNYGAVSAAKDIIEAHIRQLAVELAPAGITANAILAGVTDTPALRQIPGFAPRSRSPGRGIRTRG